MFESVGTFAESLKKKYGSALLNKANTAKELSISRATLDRMRQQGEIKSQKIRKQIRFNVKEIARVVMS